MFENIVLIPEPLNADSAACVAILVLEHIETAPLLYFPHARKPQVNYTLVSSHEIAVTIL